jgi:hypothetical protein
MGNSGGVLADAAARAWVFSFGFDIWSVWGWNPDNYGLPERCCMKSTMLLVVFLIGGLFVQPVRSGEDSNTVAALQQQIQTLKAENERLKRDNQALMKLIVESQPSSVQTPAPAIAQPKPSVTNGTRLPAITTQQPAARPSVPKTGYWLSTSSGQRHKSSCRYYGTTTGRPCGPMDGTACPLCGG